MRKRSVRVLLKWSLLANAILLATLMADHFLLGSRLALPLLLCYALFLLFLLLLFQTRTQEARPEASEDGPRVIAHR